MKNKPLIVVAFILMLFQMLGFFLYAVKGMDDSTIIDSEKEKVEATVKDAQCEQTENYIYFGFGISKSTSEEYATTIEYKGEVYNFTDRSTYLAYKDKIGKTIDAVLVTNTYKDGHKDTELELYY